MENFTSRDYPVVRGALYQGRFFSEVRPYRRPGVFTGFYGHGIPRPKNGQDLVQEIRKQQQRRRSVQSKILRKTRTPGKYTGMLLNDRNSIYLDTLEYAKSRSQSRSRSRPRRARSAAAKGRADPESGFAVLAGEDSQTGSARSASKRTQRETASSITALVNHAIYDIHDRPLRKPILYSRDLSILQQTTLGGTPSIESTTGPEGAIKSTSVLHPLPDETLLSEIQMKTPIEAIAESLQQSIEHLEKQCGAYQQVDKRGPREQGGDHERSLSLFTDAGMERASEPRTPRVAELNRAHDVEQENTVHAHVLDESMDNMCINIPSAPPEPVSQMVGSKKSDTLHTGSVDQGGHQGLPGISESTGNAGKLSTRRNAQDCSKKSTSGSKKSNMPSHRKEGTKKAGRRSLTAEFKKIQDSVNGSHCTSDGLGIFSAGSDIDKVASVFNLGDDNKSQTVVHAAHSRHPQNDSLSARALDAKQARHASTQNLSPRAENLARALYPKAAPRQEDLEQTTDSEQGYGSANFGREEVFNSFSTRASDRISSAAMKGLLLDDAESGSTNDAGPNRYIQHLRADSTDRMESRDRATERVRFQHSNSDTKVRTARILESAVRNGFPEAVCTERSKQIMLKQPPRETGQTASCRSIEFAHPAASVQRAREMLIDLYDDRATLEAALCKATSNDAISTIFKKLRQNEEYTRACLQIVEESEERVQVCDDISVEGLPGSPPERRRVAAGIPKSSALREALVQTSDYDGNTPPCARCARSARASSAERRPPGQSKALEQPIYEGALRNTDTSRYTPVYYDALLRELRLQSQTVPPSSTTLSKNTHREIQDGRFMHVHALMFTPHAMKAFTIGQGIVKLICPDILIDGGESFKYYGNVVEPLLILGNTFFDLSLLSDLRARLSRAMFYDKDGGILCPFERNILWALLTYIVYKHPDIVFTFKSGSTVLHNLSYVLPCELAMRPTYALVEASLCIPGKSLKVFAIANVAIPYFENRPATPKFTRVERVTTYQKRVFYPFDRVKFCLMKTLEAMASQVRRSMDILT